MQVGSTLHKATEPSHTHWWTWSLRKATGPRKLMAAFFPNKLRHKTHSFILHLNAYHVPDVGPVLVKRQASSCSHDTYRPAEDAEIDPKWHKGSWHVTINCDNCYETAQAALKEEGRIWV